MIAPFRATTLAISFGLAACGSSAPETTTPDEVVVPPPEAPFDPVGLFPSDTTAVVHVDVERARRSPYYGTLLGWVEQLGAAFLQGEDRLLSDLVGLLDQIDSVHLALVDRPTDTGEPAILAVVQGDLRAGLLEERLRQLGDSGSDTTPISTRQEGGQDVLVAEELSAVDLGDGRWLLSIGDRMSPMLDRLEGRGGATPRSSDVFQSLGERIGFGEHTVSLVTAVTPRMRAQAGQLLPQRVLQSCDALAFRIDGDDGLDAEAIARCNDANAAGQLTEEVARTADELAGNLFVAMLGARPVLEAIQTRVDGTDAVISLRIDDTTTRRVLGRVSGMILMAIASFGEDTGTDRHDEYADPDAGGMAP